MTNLIRIVAGYLAGLLVAALLLTLPGIIAGLILAAPWVAK